MDEGAARRARAAARGAWQIVVHRLHDETEADVPPTATPTVTNAMMVAMVWRMTQDAWAMSGRPIPDYARHEAPGRVVRRNERR
jgi:hypothetical protein